MTASSWYATAVGSFNSGAWQGEIAQFGFRGTVVDSGGLFDGAILVPLSPFDASPTADTGSTTHCTVQYGAVGTGGWSKANQDLIAEKIWTLLDALKAKVANSFSWKEIRVSAIDENWKVVNGASIYAITTPIVGSAAQTHPPQNSIVASIFTGGRTGSARGRIYFPTHVDTLATDGLVGSTTRNLIGNAVKAFLDDVNAASGVYAGVVSRGKMAYSAPTVVKIGDEVDNQQRRRRARFEQYSEYALA